MFWAIWDGLVKNPDKTRKFLKNRPDARTGAEKEDVSGETRTYGNPSLEQILVLWDKAYLEQHIGIQKLVSACSS